MKTSYFIQLSVALFCLLNSSNVFAQKEYKHLPLDLKTSKVLFIKIYPFDASQDGRKMMAKYIENHNKVVPRTNAELEEAAKNYPFEYLIIEAKDYEKYKNEGYKYVLTWEGNELVKIRPSGYGHTSYTNLFLMDTQTEDKYHINQVVQNHFYFYKKTIDELIKKVNKQYKL